MRRRARQRPQEPHPQLSVVSTEDQSTNPREEEDGILLVVPARIFGHEVRALIDSGATRNFIFPGRSDEVWTHD